MFIQMLQIKSNLVFISLPHVLPFHFHVPLSATFTPGASILCWAVRHAEYSLSALL
jgi:hypothetical protein